jgi:hypothetical protein
MMSARLVLAWRYLRKFEPSRVRAVWAALVLLCGTLGLVVPADIDGKVVAALGALSLLIPLLQGETTRAAVVPNAKHEIEVEAARYQPPPV